MLNNCCKSLHDSNASLWQLRLHEPTQRKLPMLAANCACLQSNRHWLMKFPIICSPALSLVFVPPDCRVFCTCQVTHDRLITRMGSNLDFTANSQPGSTPICGQVLRQPGRWVEASIGFVSHPLCTLLHEQMSGPDAARRYDCFDAGFWTPRIQSQLQYGFDPQCV